jgi:FdrA protein
LNDGGAVPIQTSLKANLYKDSVALMRISQTVVERTGARATLLMGTPGNKGLLAQAQLLQGPVKDAQPNDIMVVVEHSSPDVIAAAMREIQSLIAGEEPKKGAEARPLAPRSIAGALAAARDANLAQISVPGPYAGAEALKALRYGLNVFLFSDNVPLAQERAIKELAAQKNLLVMGPDCGTAIIRGVPLGFANLVRRGSIGLVGASGTGLQEVTCQIHRLGQGVSHAIGTGSRDVCEEIGGATMLQGVDLLAADADTKVIVIVSKPPSRVARERVLSRVSRIEKPVVICFLGSDMGEDLGSRMYVAATLQETAVTAAALASGNGSVGTVETEPQSDAAPAFAPGQRYIRALYSGGTFCSEAQIIWRRSAIYAYSNVPLDEAHRLADGMTSREHSAIDLGSDEFTVGRPHPMIDHRARIERLLQEARDPSVAGIVLDVVLGYGSHEDPAGVLAPAIRAAKDIAAREGRYLSVICFVCGTEEDPQRLSLQRQKLQAADAKLVESSTAAAMLAAATARAAGNAAGNGDATKARKSW